MGEGLVEIGLDGIDSVFFSTRFFFFPLLHTHPFPLFKISPTTPPLLNSSPLPSNLLLVVPSTPYHQLPRELLPPEYRFIVADITENGEDVYDNNVWLAVGGKVNDNPELATEFSDVISFISMVGSTEFMGQIEVEGTQV